MNDYLHNLNAFKELLDKYTIADLKNMIYVVPDTESGGCCYPGIQTLISLMELLGKICKNKPGDDEDAFGYTLGKMGPEYQLPGLKKKLYGLFRHGIAHNSLAKGGMGLKKSGDKKFHLSDNGNNIDLRIMYEDFEPIYNKLFQQEFLEPTRQAYYENNLRRSVFGGLKIPWLDINTPNFFNPGYTITSGSIGSGASGSIANLP